MPRSTCPGEIRTAAVLRPGERQAEVWLGDAAVVAEYGTPFAPRASTLAPGHVVATVLRPTGVPLVLWRWYDAVVVGQAGEQVVLWESGHGEVLADRRDPQQRYVPGTRAYASAGLPGAEWWVESPAGPLGEADLPLDAVAAFYSDNDLWAALG